MRAGRARAAAPFARALLPRSPQLPGLALAAALGVACHLAAPWLAAEVDGWPPLGGVSLAILVGFAVGQFLTPTAATRPGLKYAEKTVLALAIGLLGATLDLAALAELGLATAVLIVAMMVLVIAAGVGSARLLGLGPGAGWTLGVGTAVCGSSAIAATAPFVDASEEELALSIGVVNLLGTLGIFLLPALVFALGSDPAEAAVLTGGSLHAVGHVVAAGDAIAAADGMSGVGLQATAIKMGRIALLVPIVLFLALRQRARATAAAARAAATDPTAHPSRLRLGTLAGLLPNYLIAFVLLAIVHTLGWLPETVAEPLRTVSRLALAIAMAGIGLQLQLRILLRQGPRALAAGTLAWASQVLVLIAGLALLA